MDMVLDEWLIHDLRGENGEKNQKETFHFLEKIVEKCDRIVVLKGSPFMKKAFQLMTKSDPLHREKSRFLYSNILLNMNKTIMFSHQNIDSEKCPENIPEDDRYLIRLYLCSQANVFITTDLRLMDSLKDTDVNVEHRDHFLRNYLAS